MKDVQEVLKVLTEQLTNERLDNIVEQDSKYQEILRKLDIALAELQKTANPQTLEKFNTIQNEQAAQYARLAYQQGMKDLSMFFISLIHDSSFDTYNI